MIPNSDIVAMGLTAIGLALVGYAAGYWRAVAEQPLIKPVEGVSAVLVVGVALIGLAAAVAVRERKRGEGL